MGTGTLPAEWYRTSIARDFGAVLMDRGGEEWAGGRLLMQVPNVLYVERHLPERTWIEQNGVIDLIEQHWNAPTRRLDGVVRSLREDEPPEETEPLDFQRRLYTVEELAEVFDSVGLRLADVFDEAGERCVPDDTQKQLFVEAQS